MRGPNKQFGIPAGKAAYHIWKWKLYQAAWKVDQYSNYYPGFWLRMPGRVIDGLNIEIDQAEGDQ